MFDMTFVLYCDDEQLWPRVRHIVRAYGTFFRSIMVVLNVPHPEKLTADWPEELMHRLHMLKLPAGVMMGSALNKMLVHLTTERFFLLDPRYNFENSLIALLRLLPRTFFTTSPLWLSLHHREEVRSWACSWPKDQKRYDISGVGYHYVPLLPWGALLLSRQELASCGGFEQQLSFEAMMVDLSWRAQQSTVILAETSTSYVRLNQETKVPLPRWKEQSLLYKKYPQVYPCWKAWWRQFYRATPQSSQPELF